MGSSDPRVRATWTLPLPALAPLVPLLVVQGKRVRRDTVVLPPATAEAGVVGDIAAGEPWRVSVVGDSVAAGIGVADHADSLAGALARRAHESTGRAAHWSVRAQGGLTSGGIARLLAPHVDEVAASDLVVLSAGVNDTKDLHTARRFGAEVGSLLDLLGSHRPVVLLGVPPMQMFPALPRPLADVMGARARLLDRVGAAVAADRPWVVRVGYDADAWEPGADGFAEDGFHPGPAMHAALADRIWSAVGSRLG